MSKYSEEYKLRVVKAYISGEGGTETVAKKYKVARTCLKQWVAQYKLTGSFTKPTPIPLKYPLSHHKSYTKYLLLAEHLQKFSLLGYLLLLHIGRREAHSLRYRNFLLIYEHNLH